MEVIVSSDSYEKKRVPVDKELRCKKDLSKPSSWSWRQKELDLWAHLISNDEQAVSGRTEAFKEYSSGHLYRPHGRKVATGYGTTTMATCTIFQLYEGRAI